MKTYIVEFIGTFFLVLGAAMYGAVGASLCLMIMIYAGGHISGAHFNPAVTWTFFRLGKIEARDAAFYTLFQFGGGIAGIMLASLTLGKLVAHQSVNYAPTLPGRGGPIIAFFAELLISFILMSVVLRVSNTKRSTEGGSGTSRMVASVM